MNAYDLILNAIKKEKLTGREIAEKTGLSYDGIRGRISELQTKGYPIKKEGNKYYIKEIVQTTPFIIKKDSTGIILTLPMDAASGISTQQIEIFEKISKEFITNLKTLLKEIKKTKKDKMKNVMLNWDTGNLIHGYIKEMSDHGFHISNNRLFKTLEEYAGDMLLNKCRYQYWNDRFSFTRLFPNKEKLLPIGFNTYNEIRVCKTQEQRDALEKFVKIQLEKTNKIPTVDEIRKERHKIGGTKKGSTRYCRYNNMQKSISI
jgi:biotin operon repressor